MLLPQLNFFDFLVINKIRVASQEEIDLRVEFNLAVGDSLEEA
ncbi:MAG: hypothetical protein ACQJCO_01515 [cyanobacterium endosymbiont of Rhopalodia sterrenbergii]